MIGCHVSEILQQYPGVVQIYTHSTKKYGEYPHIPDLIRSLIYTETKFYIHSTFNTVPGSNRFKFFIINQFKYAEKNGAAGLVVHIPNIPISEIVEAFSNNLVKDLKQNNTIIFLEHIPGKYANPKLLKLLYAELSKTGIKFGICIDTCHAYSSGYDLGQDEIMSEYLKTVSSINCPILVHLNDSIGELGSGIDRHNTIGSKIWSKENWSSLAMLLKKEWDFIMEMNQDKYVESMDFVNYVLDMSKDDK